jgi:phenylacetate-CoA ligase
MPTFTTIPLEVLRTWAETACARGTAAGVLARQTQRIRGLIRYAAGHCPYYRNLFAGLGLDPRAIESASDLSRLPILEKETAQAQAEIIASAQSRAGGATRASTGTTGRRFVFPVHPIEDAFEGYLWARGYLAHGLRPRRLQAKIALPQNIPRRPHAWQRLGLLRRTYLSTGEPPHAKVEWLQRTRPYSLVCWASVLNEICTALEHTDALIKVPLVFSTSDMLWPELRQRVEHRLGAKVVDVYGAVETGPIAWECPAGGGYHVHSDLVAVELVDEQGRPSARGRVVCTVLWRRAFPFIRYALGDLAEWSTTACSCGSPFPLLTRLHGREEDLVRLPDGTWISGDSLRESFCQARGIRQYQLIQTAPADFLLRVVAGPEFSAETERQIKADFRRQFQNALSIQVRKVEGIQPSPAVKFTPIVTLERLARIRAQGGDTDLFLS